MFSYSCYVSNFKEPPKDVTMIAEVDVFISNYTLVDPEVYQLWVDGYSCEYICVPNLFHYSNSLSVVQSS